MKTLLLLATATAAFSLSGCVAVVDPPHPVGYSVHYYHNRPYYYTGHTRYWGYPPGYVVPRHHSRVVVY